MKKLLIAGMVVLISFSCVDRNEEQAKSTGQEIFFEETTHNYGEIAMDSDGTYKFKFKNIGDQPIIVNKVRSTCGCTIPSWPKEPVEPGKGGEIEVKYNTASAGTFMKTIIVYSSAENSPVKLVIKGKVIEEES